MKISEKNIIIIIIIMILTNHNIVLAIGATWIIAMVGNIYKNIILIYLIIYSIIFKSTDNNNTIYIGKHFLG